MSYSPFRHIDSVFWKRRPIQLTFFLTRRCNARCEFCFYLSDSRRGGNGAYELSLDEIDRISSSMGSLIWLAFSGGEIFLREDIVEIAKVFYTHNRPSIILFPTNGLLTDVITEKIESILEICKKSTVVVKLSLEGPERIHDAVRGQGSFRRTMETYSSLSPLLDKYANFEIGINSVFCSANQDSMNELISYVNRLDRVKTHTVSLIRGTVADDKLKNVDIGKYHETVRILAQNLRNRTARTYRFKGARLKAAQDILQRRLIHETLVQQRQLIPCYAGKLNLVLTESGDVYPCESFTGKLGNVRECNYDMTRILTTREARNIINSIQGDGCYCTHECYLMTNILFNPLMIPALLREYIKL